MTFCGLRGLARPRRLPSSAPALVAAQLRLPGQLRVPGDLKSNGRSRWARGRGKQRCSVAISRGYPRERVPSRQQKGWFDGLFSTDTAYRTLYTLTGCGPSCTLYILKMNSDHLRRSVMANSKDVVIAGVSTGIGWRTTQVLVSKGFR